MGRLFSTHHVNALKLAFYYIRFQAFFVVVVVLKQCPKMMSKKVMDKENQQIKTYDFLPSIASYVVLNNNEMCLFAQVGLNNNNNDNNNNNVFFSVPFLARSTSPIT